MLARATGIRRVPPLPDALHPVHTHKANTPCRMQPCPIAKGRLSSLGYLSSVYCADALCCITAVRSSNLRDLIEQTGNVSKTSFRDRPSNDLMPLSTDVTFTSAHTWADTYCVQRYAFSPNPPNISAKISFSNPKVCLFRKKLIHFII